MVIEQHFAMSDPHLGHSRVLLPEYDNRPFATIEEHDATITENCKVVGASNRTLWLMGDIARTRPQLEAFMAAIRPRWGRINLIRGNHDDRVAWQLRELFDEAHEARYVRLSKTHRFYLHHYACRVWRNSHHNSFHLHGHSHGALPRWGRSMDVSANCINYSPISFAECVRQMEHMPPINHHLAGVEVLLQLNPQYMKALDELCAYTEMTREEVLKQALRLYQAVVLGAASVQWGKHLLKLKDHGSEH